MKVFPTPRAGLSPEPERCDNCRKWFHPFVIFDDSGKDPVDDAHERCPKCEYELFVMIVRLFRCVEAPSGVKSTPTIRETNLAGRYVAGDPRRSSAAST